MITFYEKTGCLTNKKQKALLASGGYEFEVISLLDHPWRRSELEAFFNGVPVSKWFNPAAPAVKNAEIPIYKVDREAALDLLIANPLLIRRPLISSDKGKMVGFALDQLKRKLGIELYSIPAADQAANDGRDFESCSREDSEGKCP